MDDEKNKRRRGLEEVSHFFLSYQHSQSREKNFYGEDPNTSFARISHDSISAQNFEGRDNNSVQGLTQGLASAPCFQDFAEKSNKGFILLNRDKIVSHINPAAKFFLGVPDEELCGQLFNYFIREDETVQIGIFRDNRNSGIGEMYMEKTDWQGETAYLISIQDITDRLRTAEGKISFTSAGDH